MGKRMGKRMNVLLGVLQSVPLIVVLLSTPFLLRGERVAGPADVGPLTPHPSPTADTAAQGDSVDCSRLPPITLPSPFVSSNLPADVVLLLNAPSANLFGWQQFVALNWTADPKNPGLPNNGVTAGKFGEPGDMSATVWETYKPSQDVFKANAAPPSPWGAARAQKVIYSSSKFGGGPILDLSDFPNLTSFGQASRGNPWLTAQNRNLTFYEKLMNRDEFDYIVNNKLYDATQQQKVASTAGIHFPFGSDSTNCYANGPCGAIEIKAAWLPIGRNEDPNQIKKRFKVSMAQVYDPATRTTRSTLVRLVGLHIIHKTALAQQFVWATFEHVDNTPDDNELNHIPAGKSYTYYNPNCDPSKDPYQCRKNYLPTYCDPNDLTKDCVPANKCPNKNCVPFSAPNQAVRLSPVPSNSTNNVGCLNQAAWSAIRQANPDSVFQYYRLISVLWPGQSQTNKGPAKAPLPQGNPQPQAYKVANATMETYVQESLSCLDCHTFAPIAPTANPSRVLKISKNAAPGSNPSFAADYSFLLQEACTPNNNNKCPAASAASAGASRPPRPPRRRR